VYFETDRGTIVPAASFGALTRIDNATYSGLYLNGNGQQILTAISVRAALDPLIATLPAKGEHVLWPTADPLAYERIPVLAWGVTASGAVLPLTFSGLNDGHPQPVVVLHADQSVRRGDDIWISPEVWLKDLHASTSGP
jgi:hypothetical protein